MRKIYSYNPNTKTAVYKITEHGKAFVGRAKPCEEDFEYASKYAGLTIAEYKARLKRNDWKMRNSRRKIKELKKQLEQENKNLLYYLTKQSELEDGLEEYLDRKETFFNKLRRMKQRTIEAKNYLEKAMKEETENRDLNKYMKKVDKTKKKPAYKNKRKKVKKH